MKENYSKDEMKKIIEEANKLQKKKEETYNIEDITKIAKSMNIPKDTVKEALRIYNKNTRHIKKSGGDPSKRKLKKNIIYVTYFVFWVAFIFLLLIAPSNEENKWSSWVWLIPSMAFVGLIMGAFINELEGAIIGMVTGGLSGLLVLYLNDWIWGKLIIGVVLGFVAFIVFLFRFKAQIDAVIK
ncbi:MAG: hypothetical protein ACOCV8_02915 [Spirochaetota bacterium]